MAGGRTPEYEPLREMIRHRAVLSILLYLLEHRSAYKKELDVMWAGSQKAVKEALDFTLRMKLVSKKSATQPHVKELYYLTSVGEKVAHCIKNCADEVSVLFAAVPGHKNGRSR